LFQIPFGLARDMMRLSFEMQAVIGLRMFGFAMNHPRSQAEAELMVTEKIAALATAQTRYAVDVLTGNAHKAPERAVAFYRRKVRANRTRLTRRGIPG
jgi:hypothetical protein